MKALDDFKGSVQRKMVRVGLIAVGEFYKAVIKENANFIHGWSKGFIRDSIDYGRPVVSVPKGEGKILIGPAYKGEVHPKGKTADPGIYALWVEYGLKNPREGGERTGRKQKKNAIWSEKGNFSVPNYPAQPFMRKSFEEGAQQAMEVFRNAVITEINRRNKKGNQISATEGPQEEGVLDA